MPQPVAVNPQAIRERRAGAEALMAQAPAPAAPAARADQGPAAAAATARAAGAYWMNCARVGPMVLPPYGWV